MLGDRHLATSANQESDRRGYVEGVQAVAAGAADVQYLARARDFGVERRNDGFGAQFAGERGDFSRGLDFSGQRAKKIGALRSSRNSLVNEHCVHRFGDLFVAEVDGLRKLLIK